MIVLKHILVFVFTKNTLHEADFLLDELSIPTGGAVLDVGCGTGRHAVELVKRGYAVTHWLSVASRAVQLILSLYKI
ncbi:MAG: methyltransferase [Verrucomicrobia bacterium]|nr:methyltransferase [Verrucomicrobiota bacterium]